jgi:hypothetical protein
MTTTAPTAPFAKAVQSATSGWVVVCRAEGHAIAADLGRTKAYEMARTAVCPECLRRQEARIDARDAELAAQKAERDAARDAAVKAPRKPGLPAAEVKRLTDRKADREAAEREARALAAISSAPDAAARNAAIVAAVNAGVPRSTVAAAAGLKKVGNIVRAAAKAA